MCAVKKLPVFVCILSVCILHVSAQSVEELSQKFPGKYAVILNHTESMRIYFENGQPVAETKVTREILVLDDKANGLYNKYSVFHGSFDELRDIEAYTKIPDGKGYRQVKVAEIKTESSRSNGVFYDDVKESRFDFPLLVKGAIAYVSYTIADKDAHLFGPFYARSYLPVVKESFTISYPQNMTLLWNTRNNGDHTIQQAELKKGKQNTIIFTASDLKESERYNNGPAAAYYEPHVLYRIGSYRNEKGADIEYLKDVNALYRWNYGFIRERVSEKNEELKPLVDSIVGQTTDATLRAKKIYQWVQANIKYVAFENGLEGFIPRPAALVYNRRFGDCKDMACLLTSLLRMAGLNAYFTWIGTRSIPYEYDDVPMPVTDNHMICVLDLNGQWIFLDGTDPNCIFGFPSGFIQGKQCLVGISEKEYKLLRVPEIEAAKNLVVDSTFINLSEKGMTGNSSVDYFGYYATMINNDLLYKDASGRRDYVKYRMGKASNKFLLNDFSIRQNDPASKTINISAGFEVPDYGKKIGQEWYANLILEKFFTSNSFIDTAKRKVAVENEFRYTIRQYTILSLPAGYTVSSVPEDFSLSNQVISFTITYRKETNRIIACQEYQVKQLLMPVGDFPLWNESIRKIVNRYREQVVLQKQ